MSWNQTPKQDLTPKERAREIKEKIFDETRQYNVGFQRIILAYKCAIIHQESRISVLNDHGIKSEYEEQVLTEIKKL